MEKARWEREWRRRKKDRQEKPPPMQALWEEAERNKITEHLIRYQKGAAYDTWMSLILNKILSKPVKARLGALQVANPKLAYRIEKFIVDLYIKKDIEFVDFDTFKRIVERLLDKTIK